MNGKNYLQVWNEALKQIKEEFKSQGKSDEFEIWFKMEYIDDTPNEINISFASEFMLNQVVSRGYIQIIQNKIEELMGTQVQIKSQIINKRLYNPTLESGYNAQNTQPVTESIIQKPINNNVMPESPVTHNENLQDYSYYSQPDSVSNYNDHPEETPVFRKHPQLNENFTFEKFVSEEDDTAYAFNASLAAAKNPGKCYNPILIFGGVGLGKTHLMQAIGNYIYNNVNPKAKICYKNTEEFTNEFIKSLGEGQKAKEEFKNKYRKLDVLLLDDIHNLKGKETTQEELFNTFNAIERNEGQMVFTCDRPPSELKGIEERLLTRLRKGISVNLNLPTYETRCAILQKKAQDMNKVVPPEVIDVIAKTIQTNIRDLEGGLKSVISMSEMINKPLTVTLAKDYLEKIFNQTRIESITIETVQKAVAQYFKISLGDLKGSKRTKNIMYARQIAIYISRNLCNASFEQIGDKFDGKDHSTIMHSNKKIEDLIKTDSSVELTIKAITNSIKG